MLSLDEETEYDDMSLRPHKACNTVSLTKLVGGVRDVLGDRFSMLGQKERVLVSSYSMAPTSPLTSSLAIDPSSDFMFGDALGSFRPEKPSSFDEMGTLSHSLSFEAYAPGWAITRDSLLSEDITAQDWSSCAHPPATVDFLEGQSNAHMADDLLYVVAQASAPMVAAADRVCHIDVNETQLKFLQGAVASIKEELQVQRLSTKHFLSKIAYGL